MLHQLVGGSDLRLPRLGIRVPEEEVAREGHPVPELAAEQRVNRDSELLPHKIQAPELYGGMKLGAVVVEAGRGIHDLEPERLELEGVMADEVGLETFEGLLRALPSSPHLAKTDEAIVGLHLDYSAHEASPVGPAGMLERRLQWDRYGGRSYGGYLQGSSYETAGLFRQSYPEGCEQTAVDPVICSRHKARLRACEEADHLGDLFWPGNPSQGMHPAPVLDRRLDGVLPLEEIRRPSQHRRIDGTRTHGVDPYVLLGVIYGHRPRQGVDAAFARRVGGHPCLRGNGLHARHVDDSTSPTFSHLGNGVPGRQVYTLEVDTEDFVPDVLLGLRDRPVALDPGAVDEHVHPSIGLGGEIDEGFHVRRGGHIPPHPPDFQVLFAQPACRLLGLILTVAADHD